MNIDDPLRNDFYALFEIQITASQSDIRKQFRKLSKLYHPDKHTSVKLSETEIDALSKKYELINLAYSILIDPELRKEYDQLYFIEKQIKGHTALKESYVAYNTSNTGRPTDPELERTFLEKQQSFLNSSKFAEMSSKTILELMSEMQIARDVEIDITPEYTVKNTDDVNNKITHIRRTKSGKFDIIQIQQTPYAVETQLTTASINSNMFGSPFADASEVTSDASANDVQSTDRFARVNGGCDMVILPISQNSIDSYSIMRNYKQEKINYDNVSWQRSDEKTEQRSYVPTNPGNNQQSTIVKNILNM